MSAGTDTSRILFVGAAILDGTGAQARVADVLVDDDTIVAIGPSLHAEDAETLDVTGLTLAPGFIDMHSHSDVQILAEPDHEAKVTQGVTLDVLGQDGLSYAPVSDDVLAQLRVQIAGWNGDPSDFEWDWRTVEDYFARLEGAAINTAYLIPHGTLRMMVMADESRTATPNEIAAMQQLLRRGMEAGAMGLSTGLTYVPASYADTAELIALCRVVADYGGYFCPHHRNYGPEALAAYRECIEIARESEVALHFAHAHLSFEVNRGRIDELIDMIDDAIEEGLDVTFDSYPYLAGMTTLMSQLPTWAQVGTAAEQLERLREPRFRARVIDALNVTGSDGHQGLTIDWSQLHVVGTPNSPTYEWVTASDLETAARRDGREPADLCLDLLIDTRLQAPCVMFIGIEDHVRRLMQHPCHMVGSDGILVGDRPHPRAWGTFPRILETYVRDEAVLTLAEAVRHMTSSPARRLGLHDRGLIEIGYKADLVIFDQFTVAARSTYEQPRQRARGIVHVLVNGKFALRDGELTGARSGHVMRSNR